MTNCRFFYKIISIVITTLFIGCGNRVVSQVSEESTTKPLFSLPKVPITISGVENRKKYLAEHYWDSFNFGDSELLANDSLMGFVLNGYVQVLAINSASVVESSINNTLDRSLKTDYDTFEQLTSRLEDYLYDPNSPMRNEELYIYVLRYTVNNQELEDIYKIRSRNQLEMALKNRKGDIATDFNFTIKDGNNSTLHSLKSTYTILFFNTPDCEDCARVKDYIAHSALFANMHKKGELKILGIYPEEDIKMWQKAKYPSMIINGADREGKIDQNELYDLRALPTLYLLDNHKRVILKDRPIEDIESFLGR